MVRDQAVDEPEIQVGIRDDQHVPGGIAWILRQNGVERRIVAGLAPEPKRTVPGVVEESIESEGHVGDRSTCSANDLDPQQTGAGLAQSVSKNRPRGRWHRPDRLRPSVSRQEEPVRASAARRPSSWSSRTRRSSWRMFRDQPCKISACSGVSRSVTVLAATLRVHR